MAKRRSILPGIRARKKANSYISDSGKIMNIMALRKFANRANTRIRRLEKAMSERGIRSSAYEDIGGERFHFRKDMDVQELKSEATRMFTFLSNPSSTLRGALYQTATLSMEKYGDLFGKQWNNKKWHKSYSPTLDEEILSKVFSDFRKLEADKAGLIYDGFGSKELISYLYDLHISGDPDPLVTAHKALQNYYLQQQQEQNTNEIFKYLNPMNWFD